MGNDGGSIPDRRDLVKTKAKAEQADKGNQTKARWHYCALSKKPLQEPVVSCPLGKLYNKDAIIEYLLDKSAYGDGEGICGHIRSLKDVKPLKLTPNPAPVGGSDERASYICPLTSKEMNGHIPFIYIATCGCVMSQAGFKNISASTSSPKDTETEQLDVCPLCASKFSRTSDVILLNPTGELAERAQDAMIAKRKAEPPKKSKKRKNAAATEDEPASKKKALPTMSASVAAASKAVAASLAEEEAKRKANMSSAVKSLYGDGKPNPKETFMTKGTFTRYA
ncbi:DUF602-domain-containing protein [Cylindrobasidium torrendii FP15055 ss-10]|uniref:DUF602-domain-containing protein n=1 Tax=Cylindrobasidium torrendii FP15055 ss-10 TaxID=1314674 RepID=A0A0D7BHC2_9AGAR|nr:DUF602-domain-containing protein [Cylindrobasidium torrendii FP15055 ss-10]